MCHCHCIIIHTYSHLSYILYTDIRTHRQRPPSLKLRKISSTPCTRTERKTFIRLLTIKELYYSFSHQNSSFILRLLRAHFRVSPLFFCFLLSIGQHSNNIINLSSFSRFLSNNSRPNITNITSHGSNRYLT